MSKSMEKSKFSKIQNQLFATLTANILVIAQCSCIGWWSPSLLLYRSDESPLLDGYLSIDDASWIGSVLSVGAIIGTISSAILSNYFGSKTTLSIYVWPIFASWGFVICATHPWQLYLARFLAGFTGGGFLLTLPLYVAEIADQNVRGALGSLLSLNINFGILCGYILGSYVPYTYQPIVALILPIMYLIFFYFPKTPQHLLNIGKIEEAEKSLKFYRNCNSNANDEIEQLHKEFEIFQQIATQNKNAEDLKFSDYTAPTTIKALTIGPILMFISQFTGAFTMVNYAGTIFKESGSSIDPNISAIVLGVIELCGSFCCIMIIDKIGRKILLIISAAGCTIGLLIMGGYSYMSKHKYDVSSLNLVPIVSLSFVIFVSAIGLSPVSYIITAELLPLKLRRFGVTVCVTSMSFCAFTMLKAFPILMTKIELYGCMWVGASVGLIGLIFIIVAVKETKGKNLNVLDPIVDVIKK